MPRGIRLLLITVCSLLMVQSVLAEQDPATPDAMCYPVLRMDKVIPGPDCQMLVRIWFEHAVPIGGFDLLLQYDLAAVSLTGAQAAGLVAGWEYFTYRWEENKIRLVGIADITNGTHPDPSVYVPEGHIIDLCFNPFRDPQSSSNCFELNWVWEDCGDNTMASPTGDTLYVVYDIEKILPDAGCLDYHGFGPVIPLIRVINGYFCFESDCPREGDCNNDRNIDGSDVAYLINYLLRNGDEPVPGCECDSFCRADFNCDGKLNLTDISTLIRYVYYQPFALPCGIVH